MLGRRSSGVAGRIRPAAPCTVVSATTLHASLSTGKPYHRRTRQRRSRPSRPSTSLDDDDITTQDPPHDVTLDWKTILDPGGLAIKRSKVSALEARKQHPAHPGGHPTRFLARTHRTWDAQSPTTSRVTMGEPAGTPPHQKRADQAASLAQSIAELVKLRHRLLCPSRDVRFVAAVALRVPWNSIFAVCAPAPDCDQHQHPLPRPFGRPSR